MVDGIVTGHEARFDFPHHNGVIHPFLLATTPRSGSSWFGHELWATGCLGAPIEYLNFVPDSPLGHLRRDRAAQVRHWTKTLATRTSPNGVFGVKAFVPQFEELGHLNPPLLAQVMRFLMDRGPRSKVVHLVRRDRIAHAVSYARASLSGRWRAAQEGEGQGEPPFAREAVEVTLREIEWQEQSWATMFADLKLAPLRIVYEDARADLHSAIAEIAAYLGVPIDPARAVTVPAIERQRQDGAKAWIEAYKSCSS